MVDHDSVRSRIQEALEEFLDTNVAVLRDLDDDLTPLAQSGRVFVLDGGKRLRPLFAYWGHRAAGGSDNDAVVKAAASLELIQACALAHDDVIDASDTRRGRPSLHREWEMRHHESGWSGDSRRFGVAGAILLGDLFLSWSDEMLHASGLGNEQLLRARSVWDLMRAEVLAGQYLDVVEQARGGSSIERALLVAELKSGRYSVQQPLLLGAAIAGAGRACTSALESFGIDVGVAFQLRDDLLGVFGDPATTGKPAGDDLREGKRTVLVAAALATATASQAAMLSQALGDPGLTDSDVNELRGILRASGAESKVESMIAQRSDRALAKLASADLSPDGREALLDLAGLALERRA